MRIEPDQLAVTARQGEELFFGFVVLNDSNVPESFAYGVEVDSDDLSPDWIIVTGPHQLDPGRHGNGAIEVRFPAGEPPPADYVVRATAVALGSGLAASTAVQLEVVGEKKPCLRFPGPPSFELNPDGSVTASLSLFNCGGFDLSISLDIRHEDGWRFAVDSPELSVSASKGPVEIELTLEVPPGEGIKPGSEITVSASHGDKLLAQARGELQKPAGSPTHPRRNSARWAMAAVVVGVFLIGGVVLADALDAPTEVTSPIPTPSAEPTAITSDSGSPSVSETFVGPDISVDLVLADDIVTVTVTSLEADTTGVTVLFTGVGVSLVVEDPKNAISPIRGSKLTWTIGEISADEAAVATLRTASSSESWSVTALAAANEDESEVMNNRAVLTFKGATPTVTTSPGEASNPPDVD